MSAGSAGPHPAPASGETRKVARAAAISGVATVAAALAGVTRVKLQAVFLGASGVGVMAQVQNLQNTLNVLAMLGVGMGISRDVARARGRGDAEAVRRIFRTARTLTTSAAVIGVVVVLVLARPLSQILFGDPGYAWLLRLAAPVLLFYTVTRTLVRVLNGHAEYGTNARYTLASSAISVVVLVLLLPPLGLLGAGVALPGTALLSWMAMEHLFRRQHPELRASGYGYERAIGRVLLGIGGASLVVASADQVAQLAVRTWLIQSDGLEANGWFQGVWGLSQHVLTAAIAFQGTYSFARVSGIGDPAERIAETNRTIRMTLLLVTPMTAGMILLREPMVRLFLSPEFQPSLPLFAPQAAGTLLRAVGMAIGIGALAMAPLRWWLAIGLSTSGSFVTVYWLLQATSPLLAAPTAYAISGAVHVLVSWLVMRRHAALRLEPAVLRLAVASGALLLATFLIADQTLRSYLWGALLFVAWASLGVSAEELRKVGQVLRNRLGGSR